MSGPARIHQAGSRQTLAQALVAILAPALNMVFLSIVPARQRPHLSALAGIFTAVGAILGSVFLSGIDSRFGITGALVALAVPGVIGS